MNIYLAEYLGRERRDDLIAQADAWRLARAARTQKRMPRTRQAGQPVVPTSATNGVVCRRAAAHSARWAV